MKNQFPQSNQAEVMISPVKVEYYLRECWEAMSPPVRESYLLGIPQERKVPCILEKLQGSLSLKKMEF